MKLAGWGNYPRVDAPLLRARGAAEVLSVIDAQNSLIARGNGRAYGDAALNREAILSMLSSDRILAFDPSNGRLTAEAGLMLADLITIFAPRGWFVPVTPGTKFVTLGGMVAADVHGKNHHRAGSFCDHVECLEMALADGSIVTCGPTDNPELFAATRGGMGLTGVILTVTFHLQAIETVFMRQKTVRARNLADAMALFEDLKGWTYLVGWIDCLAQGDALGRCLIYGGEHASLEELPPDLRAVSGQVSVKPSRRLPINLPAGTLNRWSVGAFNTIYYWAGRPGTGFVGFDSFFYPLDALLEWNRIYGRAGFVQYQCVLPKTASFDGLTAVLRRVARSGRASFLAVLKLFGPEAGILSFPMEGYTLALDFPADAATFRLLSELDAVVADHGGRLYLAKDARAAPATLRSGYPRLAEFQALRHRYDPGRKFTSLQSQRLDL